MISEISAKTRLGMPSTLRRPKAVASHATVGAMKICEPMPAVESHAPSSKLSEKAPRRSGSPTVVRRLSKLARNEPSRTAPTANKGCGAMPPRDRGPWPASFSAIRSGIFGVDVGNNRHARQQPLQQRLVGIERDPDRDALHDLGEIAGGVVRRQQRELRTGGRRNPLHAAVQFLMREAVDRQIDGLTRPDPSELRFLEIRDYIDIRQRHDVDQIGAYIDIVARL